MADSAFTQAVASIQSKLRPFLALSPVPSFQRTPSFDVRTAYSPLKTRLHEIPTQVASLGLPEETARAIISVLSAEGSKYHGFVESSRRQLLEELSLSAASTNPSELPSLVEAACRAFLDNSMDSSLWRMRECFGNLALQDSGSEQEGSEDSDSASESDGDDEDIEADQELEEDENTPMKPGEEVPPLDTKFLPIFEALHERGKVLTKPEKTYLVNMTGMTYRQITIWFQNRRRGELKEDANIRASSCAASAHSLDSSDVSEDELNFEQRLNSATDTTFDIRSWRLTSALATKDGHGPSLPPSPSKFTFGAPPAPDFDVDSTDLSDDSDDEIDVPPGLRVPSLTGSVTTLDSTTTASVQSSQAISRSFVEPAIAGETSPSAGSATLPRPVKALPLSRRGSPPTPSQPPQPQAPAFNFNFTGVTPTPAQQQFSAPLIPIPVAPSSLVTSNERGLAVEMNLTPPPSTSTLQSASTAPPTARFTTPPAPSTVAPSSPAISAGSRQNSSSPSPRSSSPRPTIKPLPRRTGCAPRPRPPPRAPSGSTSASTPVARPSIVLPPASNPSLAATTLGALLRPSLPAPAIPVDMQERLSAMAGRMGVGSGPNSAGKSASAGVQPPNGSIPGGFPSRGVSFSFGATALPKMGPPSGAPVPERQVPTPAGGSPMSS
ncbi:hypothetical protein FRC06_002709 [Ceratobasidium sp. 370]|nr:hypothetical protein FRC06_002709 [Ceratobasidium sp. 370]